MSKVKINVRTCKHLTIYVIFVTQEVCASEDFGACFVDS